MPSLAEDLGIRAGALATAMLVAVTGCGGGLPGAQGDAAAPVLVSGRVVDAAGAPVGGAPIQLVVNDYGANIPVGGVVPNVFQASFTANVDGSFAIHLAPTPELLAFAQEEGGFVNFNLYSARPGQAPAVWAFPRELIGGTWAGDIPAVELHPIGST